MTPDPLDDELFERGRLLFGKRCGLRFEGRNRDLLLAGLDRAAKAHGLPVARLLEQLDCDPRDPLPQSVLREVTIGETYFFRHPEHYQLVRERMLPEWSARERPIRCWSAGCATGEEAYSLAILLEAAFGRTRDWSVLGTDLNRHALEAAERGVYGCWSVRHGLPASSGVVERPDRTIELTSALKERVRFAYCNLNDAILPSLAPAGAFDLIFCRNVLLYLFSDSASAILERLRDCLSEGGYLVVGALDLDLAPAGLEQIVHQGAVVLRRVPLTSPPRASRPPARPTPPPAAPRSPEIDAVAHAKAAADRGELELGISLARQAVELGRSPTALHLLALILTERGDSDEPVALLREACERAPDYALAHLGLALHERSGPPADRARLLKRVLTILENRADKELLPGPDPLPVSWVRMMAAAALQKLGGP